MSLKLPGHTPEFTTYKSLLYNFPGNDYAYASILCEFTNLHERDYLAIYLKELSVSAHTDPSHSSYICILFQYTGIAMLLQLVLSWWTFRGFCFIFIYYFEYLHLCQYMLWIHRKHSYPWHFYIKMYALWKTARYYWISFFFKKRCMQFYVLIWLHWVFAAEAGFFYLQCTGSRHSGFSGCGIQTNLLCGLSCLVACGIFLDQGLNLWPLHWQVDS